MGQIRQGLFGYSLDFFGAFIAKIIKGWKVSVSLLSIVFIFFSAIVQSFQEASIMPFITEVGGRILSADNELYIKSNEVLLNPEISRWGFAKIWSVFLVNLWVLILIGFLIYVIVRMRNSSAVGANIVIAVMGLAILEMFFSFYLISQDVDTLSAQEIGKQIIPFKGVVQFTKALPIVTGGVQATPFDVNETFLQPVGGA